MYAWYAFGAKGLPPGCLSVGAGLVVIPFDGESIHIMIL